MLAKCQECGGKVSDSALSCPHCAAVPEAFLGPPRPCDECGEPFRPSYSRCASCGAPSEIAHVQRAPQPEPISVPPKIDDALTELAPDEADADGADISWGRHQLPRIRLTWNFLRFGLIAFVAARTVVLVELLIMFWLMGETERGVLGRYDDLQSYVALVTNWDPTLVAISIAVFAATGVAYAFFVYRALKRLRDAHSPHVELSPWWGTWGVLVPIATWFVPFMAIRQIWRGTMAHAKKRETPPLSVALWWICWLIASLSGAVSAALERQAGTNDLSLDMWRVMMFVDITAAAAFALSGVFLLSITRRVADAWDESRKL